MAVVGGLFRKTLPLAQGFHRRRLVAAADGRAGQDAPRRTGLSVPARASSPAYRIAFARKPRSFCRSRGGPGRTAARATARKLAFPAGSSASGFAAGLVARPVQTATEYPASRRLPTRRAIPDFSLPDRREGENADRSHGIDHARGTRTGTVPVRRLGIYPVACGNPRWPRRRRRHTYSDRPRTPAMARALGPRPAVGTFRRRCAEISRAGGRAYAAS